MRHSVATEELIERAALYALGALSQHEARAFEFHLGEGCSVCEAELAGFDNVVGTLGYDARETAPPAYLRDLLTARIERETESEALESISLHPGRRDRGLVRPESPRASKSAVILPWALAASLALASAASLLAWRSALRTITDQEIRIGRVTNLFEEYRQELAQTNENLGELTRINEALGAPGTLTVRLEGKLPSSPAKGMVYWERQNSQIVVRADLPVAPPGKVYQLWFVAKGPAPLSAGLLKTDPSGHGFVVVSVPADINKGSFTTAITLEPEGGSPQPTPPIYAAGQAGS